MTHQQHPSAHPQSPTPQPRVRLNKYLAASGVASRRKADQLILDGSVAVNGRVIQKLGTTINPLVDTVSVSGKPVTAEPAIVVYALYKPRGVVSTASETERRKTVLQFVPKEPRVFSVGRLDLESEGLLLLTNDGDLALKLTHPRYAHTKRYRVSTSVPRRLDLAVLLGELRKSRYIDGRHRKFDSVTYVGRDDLGLVFDVEVHEGLKHLVRRLVDRAGLTTLRLIRTAHGPITLGSLKPGEWRPVDTSELSGL